ncbi:hypothetical protein P153DRAFT_399452 [Dothidotthia symphoricarpi CBS 119687]|uniref:Uncharacterized protein n=1 Tax=Dothidotthia symphoricarpi CBS 119687 TaxID=1392245 RepID=A0A6A6A4C9_9PLEO|nr:uncharacterized protein P153DRAFT_399452 [Dothidotthia symphoricarpi CBS 119687]KAF2125974.1 hypothetical protein P153DRAFT_399452 [Dothidotthia symphoricarpi CBS 119687]
MSRPADTEKTYYSVQQTEPDAAEPDVAQPATRVEKTRRFWEKLSVYNVGILIGGTVAIALALAILLFLWGGATTARQSGLTPRFWRQIAGEFWAGKVVTLCSVALRIATGTQLSVFAALVAALILERVGASTTDLPHLSMIRCSNTGPLSLMWNVWHTMRIGSQLGYSALVVVAVLNAFALQFTSTLLLTDFDYSPILFEPYDIPVPFGLKFDTPSGDTTPYQGVDFWHTGPASYPQFAEYSEAGSQSEGFVDTGKSYRGFLPIREPEVRAALRNYTGAMTVVDTRVVCVKPTVSSLTVSNWITTTVSGVLRWEDTHPPLKQNDATGYGFNTDSGYSFNCTLPIHDSETGTGKPIELWAVALCTLDFGIVDLTGGLGPDWHPEYTMTTAASLLLNTTGNYTSWNQYTTDNSVFDLEQLDSSDGLWDSHGRADVRVDTSLCFTNPSPYDYHIKSWRQEEFSDATLQWNSNIGAYDTDEVARMLGVTSRNTTLESRGLYHLEPASNWTAAQVDVKYGPGTETEDFVWDALNQNVDSTEGQNHTYMMSSYAGSGSIHRTHIAVFQHILKTSRNPALALQALYTILMQMAYYDFLPQFDVKAPASLTSVGYLFVPQGWRAFGIIMGLLALHFTLLATALVLFLTKTEMSLLGNAWQAVTQVISKDTANAMHHGSAMTDREMDEYLSTQETTASRIRIARLAANGQAETITLRRRPGHDNAL